MKSHVRVSLLAPLVGAILTLLAVSAPGAQAAFGVEKLVAVNCSAGHEACAHEIAKVGPFEYSITKEPSLAEAEAQGFTQAGGHVPFGITDFKVNTKGSLPTAEPEGVVTHIRTDVAPGLATSPAAVTQCSLENFGTKEAVPGTGLFGPSNCAGSEIGENEVTVFVKEAGLDIPLRGTVYNLAPTEGLASEFGVALDATPLGAPGLFAHTLIKGNVEWGQEAKGTNQADYHDYFEIDVSPALPLVSSRLVFEGTKGRGDFITNATNCPGNNTTSLSLTDAEGTTVTRPYTTPIGLTGCNLVPFAPTFSVFPGAGETASDRPDGITTELALPQNHEASGISSSQLKTASITLPEGMTMNPSAAHGLEACTPKQFRMRSATPGVECPGGSKIGTLTLNVPQLQNPLQGSIYLGGPESGPITDPPFTIYLDAESSQYGISVRLKGIVTPNPTTGRLTTTFTENPEQPFSNVILHFNGGALAPIANPLACGNASSEATFSPFSGTGAVSPFVNPFAVDSNGAGGGCPSPLPFAPTQSTQNQAPGNAGANTSYTISYERGEGQQYLSEIKTTLPAGLAGAIPTVTQCGEPQASKDECPAASQIGSVVVTAGSGPTPFQFTGPVYMTGPYAGAPFGMSIVVPANAGPFSFGNVISRATINIDPYTGRVIVGSQLPRIFKGVPLRLRKVVVSVNKQGFLRNPTNCGALATESTLTGFVSGVAGGSAINLSSPFQVGNCNALQFKPSFKATTGAKTSKANGASLETTINQPAGQANIKSVLVQLPKQLPSRLTTLQKACTEATFNANPFSCPEASKVGGARANTPLLPGKLSGPAYLVSHGGAAFPDLDLVMEANGVRIILVGHTNIKNGITTTNFSTAPDAPVSSITVNLPTGPHSALAANGNLCASKLSMPTTITGQNGVVVKQNTTIAVKNCPVRVVGAKTSGNNLKLTVQTYTPGRISAKGSNLRDTFSDLGKAQKNAALKVRLSSHGRAKGRPFKVKVRVGFLPKNKKEPTSVAYTTVKFE
jgi:hypothetical protein